MASSERTLLPSFRYRLVALTLTALFLFLYYAWFHWGGSGGLPQATTNTLTLVYTSLTVCLISIRATRLSSTKQTFVSWIFISTGLAFWTLYNLVDFSRQLLAFPSWVPLLFYLIGALCWVLALMFWPEQPRVTGRLGLFLDMGITTTAFLCISWLGIFNSALAGPELWVERIGAFADLLLLLVILNLFLLSQATEIDSALLWFGLGLGVNAACNFGNTLLKQGPLLQGQVLPGEMWLMYWGWALADGLILQAPLKQVYGPLRLPRSPRLIEGLQLFLPALATLASAFYALGLWQLTGKADTLALWATVILSLALITRQGIRAGEVEFQQYASLVNSMAEPSFVCDRQGRLRLVSPALLNALGYAQSDDLLNHPFTAFLEPGAPSSLHAYALKQGWSGEVNLIRRDHSLLPVSLSLRPIPAGSQGRLALAGSAHDLSEQKHQQAALQQAYHEVAAARQALEQLNSQLEQRVAEKTASLSEAYLQLEEQNRSLQVLDQMKSDFVSLVSHELRAPLTNIRGGIELALSNQRTLPLHIRETLELVEAETRRLSRFVETILDLSALDAGRNPIYPEATSIQPSILSLKKQMLHLPGAERVRWAIPSDFPYFLADQQAVTSILFHLIDNALKYAPGGEILITSGVTPGRVWIQVADEGPGIPEEGVALLFTRFSRLNPTDSQSIYGHGLGLYIVRRLLEAMNGEILAKNRPGGGASFTFWLPRVNF